MTRTYRCIRTMVFGGFFGSFFMALIGCQGHDVLQPTFNNPATVVWRIEANHKAIMLSTHAPFDTVQLSATPKNVYGETLHLEEPPRFQFRKLVATDTTVQLDSVTGFVRAHAPVSEVKIEIASTFGNIRQVDTVSVMIRDEFPVQHLDSLDLQPLPPDSSWRWAGQDRLYEAEIAQWLRVYTTDGQQLSAFDVAVHYSWDDNSIVACDFACGMDDQSIGLVGETYIRAEIYAYGKTITDSMLFRRVDPLFKQVAVRRLTPANGEPGMAFFPSVLTVRPGTTVAFVNRGVEPLYSGGVGDLLHRKSFPGSELRYTDSVDVTFDDPAHVVAADTYEIYFGLPGVLSFFPSDGNVGNIEPFAYRECIAKENRDEYCGGFPTWWEVLDEGSRSRKFVQPGTYRYRSTRYPSAVGTIIVKE